MSNLQLDIKYANMLAFRLERFKTVKRNLFKSRCPLCGDSATNKRKTRFYIYEDKGSLKYKCHKCGKGGKLFFFLKDHHPDLYNDYCMDEFGEKKLERQSDPILEYTKPKYETSGILKNVKRISQLPHTHKAKTYVESRLIPPNVHSRLYFHLNFIKWINELIPDKIEFTPEIDPRLVIPLIDRKGRLFGVQGRALTSKQTQRYITIRFDESDSTPKLFGLDKVDPNRKIYILEGPIDSLFIPNAIALAGADCSPDLILEYTGTTKDRLVYVFDNERRGKHITDRMERLMKDGYNVCIWPKKTDGKDVNQMVLNGASAADIALTIDNNTFTGIAGQLQLASWIHTS